MPLSTLENGDTGLQARTKINAAIAAVNASATGGTTIVRAMGALQGSTEGAVDPNVPTAWLETSNWAPGDESVITLSLTGSPNRKITVAAASPTDGSDWINTATILTNTDLATALASIISSYPEYTSISPVGTIIYFSGRDTGAAYTISPAATGEVIMTSGNVSGGDGHGSSGEITSVTLIPQIDGKKLLPLRAGVFGSTEQLSVKFKLLVTSGPGTGEYDLCDSVSIGNGSGAIELGQAGADISAHLAEWINGRLDASLVAYLDDWPPDGSSVNVWAIAEQV